VSQVSAVKIRHRLALLFKPSMIRRTAREGERERESGGEKERQIARSTETEMETE